MCTSERHVITSVYISFVHSRFEFAFSLDPERSCRDTYESSPTDSVMCAWLDRELTHHRREIEISVIYIFDHTHHIKEFSDLGDSRTRRSDAR